ncbi:MAG: isochorismate synthase [Actinomycetes bacterium]
MSSHSKLQLVARSRIFDSEIDLLAIYNRDDFIWLKDGVGFIAIGSVIEIAPGDVEETLAAIKIDDQVTQPGSGAIAVGALPFSAMDPALLTIPQLVIGRSAGGGYWITEIRDCDEEMTATIPAGLASEAKSIITDSGTTDDKHSGLSRTGGTSRSEWSEGVSAVLSAIGEGRVEKVVLARDLIVRAENQIDLRQVVTRLVEQQRESFIYAHRGLVGASPELLLRRHGALATSTPMAGTADGTDAAAIASLVNSPKDAREHEVVVEAVIGALAPYTFSTARVRGPEILALPGVVHLATAIEVDLLPDAPGALDLARILHPTPAVGGWPVNESRELIAENEKIARGRYAGPVGWVDQNGDGEFAIALRSAEIEGDTARCFAGAGIVAGSEPDAEWGETERKLAPILKALGA